MIYQGQPPCDPNTWEVHLDQRRAIDAWIRSREVICALPQRASVLKPDRAGKPLFLKKAEWTNDFQAACAQADLDHRLILLDFFSPT